MISKALQQMRDALTLAEEAHPAWTESLPMRTTSKLNDRQHWAKVGRSTKSHRQQWAKAFKDADALRRVLVGGRLVVLMTRCAPRFLDSDNLAGALKAIQDGVADGLGVTDSPNGPVTWLRDQEHCKEPRVRVEVFVLRASGAKPESEHGSTPVSPISPARALKTDSDVTIRDTTLEVVRKESGQFWPAVRFFDDGDEVPDGTLKEPGWREEVDAALKAVGRERYLPKRDSAHPWNALESVGRTPAEWRAMAKPNFVKGKP